MGWRGLQETAESGDGAGEERGDMGRGNGFHDMILCGIWMGRISIKSCNHRQNASLIIVLNHSTCLLSAPMELAT